MITNNTNFDSVNARRNTLRMRAKRPFVFTNFKSGEGVDQIAKSVIKKGGFAKESDT